MQGRLIERTGERAGRVHLLSAPVTTIGRGAENALVVPSGHVSGRHACVTWDGAVEAYVLEDLGSKNGTFLNGARLAGPQSLRAGDEVALAPPLGPVFAFEPAEVTLTVGPGGSPTAIPAPVDHDQGAHGVRIDGATAEVWADGVRVHLTAKEYLALALLAERGGALVGKEELAARVWPEFEGQVSDESILRLLSRLRRKLELDPERPRHLITVRGLGVRFVARGTER